MRHTWVYGIVVLAIGVASIASYESCGDDPALSGYKAQIAGILDDLAAADDGAGTGEAQTFEDLVDDPVLAQTYLEQVRRVGAQWADGVARVQTALDGISPPAEASSLHADLSSRVAEFRAAVEDLTGNADYSAAVTAVYSELSAAAGEGSSFAEWCGALPSDPDDLRDRLGRLARILQTYAAGFQALEVPGALAQVHVLNTDDLGALLQTLEQLFQTAGGPVDPELGEAQQSFDALTGLLASRALKLDQDFRDLWAAFDSAQSGLVDELKDIGDRLGDLEGAIGRL